VLTTKNINIKVSPKLIERIVGNLLNKQSKLAT